MANKGNFWSVLQEHKDKMIFHTKRGLLFKYEILFDHKWRPIRILKDDSLHNTWKLTKNNFKKTLNLYSNKKGFNRYIIGSSYVWRVINQLKLCD